jgi:hypothetical protein
MKINDRDLKNQVLFRGLDAVVKTKNMDSD